MNRRDWYWLVAAALAALLAWEGKPAWDDWSFVRAARLSQETQLQQTIKQQNDVIQKLQAENAELKKPKP